MKRFWNCVGLLALVLLPFSLAGAQTYEVLHTFSAGGDGSFPYAGLTPDGVGGFYGTASEGGANRHGVVFRLKPAGSGWTLSPLYSFNGGDNDGSLPEARVNVGPDGALYGTTSTGGPDELGTVYKLTPSPTFCHTTLCPWIETVLHIFPTPLDTDGFYPVGDLAFDRAGNIYGATESGGSGFPYGCSGLGCGVVFQLANSQGAWTENIIHEFTGRRDGGNPDNGVILDDAGHLLGTTCTGGLQNSGMVFQISVASWLETPIYNFAGGLDGICPGTLTPDGSGNMYSITEYDGAENGGTAWELIPGNGGWSVNQIYAFSRNAQPSALTRDSGGNLYGATLEGGANGRGSVFKLTPSGGGWVYTSLHDFSGGSDGARPNGPVVVDNQGKIYGTTTYGGAGCQQNGCGVIFKITP